jgi:hypothetical protein
MTNSFNTTSGSLRPWWRPSFKRVLIFLMLIAIGTFGTFGYLAYREVFYETLPDCYAQMWVADMTIEYMEWNNGAWPGSWNDLQEPYEVCVGRSGRPWSFDELRRRVGIDFSAKSTELAKATLDDGQPPFRVIYLRNGKRHHWEGSEPNSIVWRYLEERAKRPTTYKYPKRPDPTEKEARQRLLALGARWKLNDNGRVAAIDINYRCSDDSLAHVRSLKDLREVNLGDSDVTDEGMKNLEDLSHVRQIFLYRTNVGDSGLAHLHNMQDLETLVLADKKFTDGAFEHITKLRKLKLLNLNGARVTDAGIAQLHDLKSLKEVLLGETGVTEDGIRKLQQALPDCRIYHTSVAGR